MRGAWCTSVHGRERRCYRLRGDSCFLLLLLELDVVHADLLEQLGEPVAGLEPAQRKGGAR